jgi:hypothetical protein
MLSRTRPPPFRLHQRQWDGRDLSVEIVWLKRNIDSKFALTISGNGAHIVFLFGVSD